MKEAVINETQVMLKHNHDKLKPLVDIMIFPIAELPEE